MRTTSAPPSAVEFEAERPRLFGIAYRMLGSAAEAEDAVQDAYLRWHAADRSYIDAPGPWLAKVLTNLCLNRLTSARVRREEYVGPWLPEPVRTDAGALGPLETAEQREAVSMAVLVLMERLSPPERAAVVLRDAFEYSHREIAEVLDVSEAAARQTYRRAKQHLADGRARFEAPVAPRTDLLATFLAAAAEGALDKLESLLAEDAVTWADGGGKVRSATRPVTGRSNVARFVIGLFTRFVEGVEIAFTEVNGDAAVLGWENGRLIGAASVDIGPDGLVTGVRIIRNPDKLAFLENQSQDLSQNA
ncbi:RNA polymerase sigma-70 factor [Yinghuangia seranimata]|uniref:RNA polymerase sigma-70 factor n=1 Tax=Yinghuangia seranimata TaxID=408067 RepID=UPI00248BCEC1|nr:RNA polymerase sigma-70 factor [Yinghuangia seranimata]MDI2126304.1 RNA polymerase sigma-70 factor [Yinghuangia seranimata]